MGIYTKGGSINAVISDTSVTRGRYTTDSALRVTPVSGSTFTGETAPDGSVNVTNYDGLRGLYHPSGAIRGFFSNSETAISGLYHRSGALNLYASVSNASLELIGETNGLSLNFLDNTSDIVTSGVSVKSTATGTIAFTRASLATVTDSDGKIKWAPHNLLLASEQFDAAQWVKGDTTVSANSILAPNGTTTADKIVETATTAQHYAFQSYDASLVGVPYTWGIWLKGAERTLIQLALDDFATGDVRVAVNLSAGTIGTATASGNFTSGGATISDAGSGWYYVTLTSIKTAGANVLTIPLIRLGSGSYLGVAGSGIYAWGAHLYRSDLGGMQANASAYPMYNPSTTAAAGHGPRLDYNASTLAPLGLLVEEQRTNLLLRSAEFDNVAWSKVGATITGSVTSPDGTLTADTLTENTATATAHNVIQSGGTVGVAETLSVYAKPNGRNWIALQLGGVHVVYYDIQNGVFGNITAGATATITFAGNGWYRCSMTATRATNTNNSILLATGNGTFSYNGDGTSGVHLWGAQVEAGSFATSYIPTVSSTVTRSPDVVTVPTSSFPYNVNTSTLVVSASQLSSSALNSWLYSFDNGTGNDRFFTIVGPNNPVNTLLTSNLVGQFNQGITPSITTTPFKSGFTYALNNANMAVNGVLGTTDTTLAVPTASATTLRIGTNTLQTVFFNGHFRQITYIPRRISNSELQARTTL